MLILFLHMVFILLGKSNRFYSPHKLPPISCYDSFDSFSSFVKMICPVVRQSYKYQVYVNFIRTDLLS